MRHYQSCEMPIPNDTLNHFLSFQKGFSKSIQYMQKQKIHLHFFPPLQIQTMTQDSMELPEAICSAMATLVFAILAVVSVSPLIFVALAYSTAISLVVELLY